MNNKSDDTSETRTGTQSLQRAVALLRALMDCNREGASSSELATRVAIDRTTVHRMLKCLVEEGLVFQDSANRRYFLGPLAYELGLAAAERMDLRTLCKAALTRIAEETGDTVFLMIRSGDDSVCIDRAEGSYPVKTFVVDIGTRRPLGIGAGSLAILSALSSNDADAVLARNGTRVSAYDGMTVDRLRRMMAEARNAGHVAMEVVNVPGVRAVSVPIITTGGRAIAALSVAAVSLRMTPEREEDIVNRLHGEATKLCKLLSGAA
jgi:DNA-binding IclR family transcriptional regulator